MNGWRFLEQEMGGFHELEEGLKIFVIKRLNRFGKNNGKYSSLGLILFGFWEKLQ